MCGITGIIDNKLDKERRRQIVQAMNDKIIHRGPDENGEYHDETASLAMRRLAIIDLKSGSQPIFNHDKSLVIVFNGEIYNYRELKQQLIDQGHSFSTNSDTEVVLHLFEEYQEQSLNMLKGMFAFCIYNSNDNSCFLARDRFGERPLYYYKEKQHFTFSSELSSLLLNPTIKRKLNHEVLPYYLGTMMVPEPMTFYQGVYQLQAGNYLWLRNSSCETKSYFSIEYDSSNKIEDEQEAIEFITPKIRTAVSRQLVSDVPVGAFLSGGIDSSTMVAFMAERSSTRVPTFTAKFENQSYDESVLARLIAEKYNTDHHEVTIPNESFKVDFFYSMLDHFGFPFPDSSAIPTFLLSKEISQHLKVAIGGDGGDELFGGYSAHQWWQSISQKTKNYPKSVLEAFHFVNSGLSHLPIIRKSGAVRQISRFLSTGMADEKNMGFTLHQLFTSHEYQRLTGNLLALDVNNKMSSFPEEWKNYTSLRKAMYFRIAYNLPTDMLIKTDRMALANSLEVRLPFLDPDLFEASKSIHDQLLIKNGVGKYLLRKLMKEKLPEQIFNAPKQGFSLPLYQYFNEDFAHFSKNLINDPIATELFDEKELHNIWKEGTTIKKDNAKTTVYRSTHQLWAVVLLIAWIKKYNVEI